jgi:hypothetical protein
MSTVSHQSTRADATGDATAYPWGWLGALGTVIVLMFTGAGWLYQKNGNGRYPRRKTPEAWRMSRRLQPPRPPQTKAP